MLSCPRKRCRSVISMPSASMADRHSVTQQMWVDALADAGCYGDGADDLPHALARQHVRRWPRTLLAAGEQRPSPPRANVQSKQLRQVASDRDFPVFAALTPAGS